MEHSYYLNGILIKNGTLILSKWNTHIIKRKYSYQKEHSGKPSSYFLSYCKKQNYNNKRDVLIFSLVFTPRVTHVAEIGLWTLRPRFLSGFNSP